MFWMLSIFVVATSILGAVSISEKILVLQAQPDAQDSKTSLSPVINKMDRNDVIDLLNGSMFEWKPHSNAKVFQNDDELYIIVDSSKKDKTYNRAYLQTNLNGTEVPMAMSLGYSFKSSNGSADLAYEIREPVSNSILLSQHLNKDAKSALFLLPQNIYHKPVELRLYIITEEPSFSVLEVKEANLILEPGKQLQK